MHCCREESACLPPQSAIHLTTDVTTDVNTAYTVAERNPLAFRPKVQSTAATTQAVNDAQTQEPSSLSARHMKVKKKKIARDLLMPLERLDVSLAVCVRACVCMCVCSVKVETDT